MPSAAVVTDLPAAVTVALSAGSGVVVAAPAVSNVTANSSSFTVTALPGADGRRDAAEPQRDLRGTQRRRAEAVDEHQSTSSPSCSSVLQRPWFWYW